MSNVYEFNAGAGKTPLEGQYFWDPKIALDNFAVTLDGDHTAAARAEIVNILKIDDAPSVYLQLTSGINHVVDILKKLTNDEQIDILSNLQKGELSLVYRINRFSDKNFMFDFLENCPSDIRLKIVKGDKDFIHNLVHDSGFYQKDGADDRTKDNISRLLTMMETMSMREKASLLWRQNVKIMWDFVSEPELHQGILRALRSKPKAVDETNPTSSPT